MELQTERLLLRPFRESDLHDFHHYCRHPEVGPNAGWKPHESLEESQKVLDIFINGEDTIWAVTLRGEDKPIGSVGLHRDERRPGVPNCLMLGYALSAEHWGKGLMTEAAGAVIDFAFTDKSLALLSVYHFAGNQRSRRVIEKCGFVCEGLIRCSSCLYDGTIVDEYGYSLSRADYYARKGTSDGRRLVLPEEGDFKEAYLTYLREWGEEKLVPFSAGLRGDHYEQWLAKSIADRETAPTGFVPATTYFLIDSDQQILAVSNLRHELNQSLLQTGGHIGYGVRPSKRGNGLAKQLLALTLRRAKVKGINRALLTCSEENEASARTIEALGGVPEEKFLTAEGDLVRRYWVDIR